MGQNGYEIQQVDSRTNGFFYGQEGGWVRPDSDGGTMAVGG